MATARASTPVRSTNSTAWSGSVRFTSPEPTSSSMPPSVPSSPSTVTPDACAISTTSRVTPTLYSKSAGVLPSSISEPSIMTLVKPRSMALLQVSGELPWSWCRATEISGYTSVAASMRWYRKRSLAYLRASRSLDDDGRFGLPRGLHDRLYLLQVVDVERPYAVAPVRRLVQKLAHRNQCHVSHPPTSKYQNPPP